MAAFAGVRTPSCRPRLTTYPFTKSISGPLRPLALAPGQLSDEQVARVALLVHAWSGHGRPQVREPAEHAVVSEPVRDRLGHGAVLDRQQRAAGPDEPRQPRRHLDRVVSLGSQDYQIEPAPSAVPVHGGDLRHLDRQRASHSRHPHVPPSADGRPGRAVRGQPDDGKNAPVPDRLSKLEARVVRAAKAALSQGAPPGHRQGGPVRGAAVQAGAGARLPGLCTSCRDGILAAMSLLNPTAPDRMVDSVALRRRRIRRQSPPGPCGGSDFPDPFVTRVNDARRPDVGMRE